MNYYHIYNHKTLKWINKYMQNWYWTAFWKPASRQVLYEMDVAGATGTVLPWSLPP